MEMKNRYYRPNNLPSRIVYHTEKEFKLDMLFLAVIILIGVVAAITGLISIILQISPEL
jgi:hypothetical protein